MKKMLIIIISLFLISCSNSTIKIGFTAGLTGPLADEAIATRNGFILAVEELNENGGIIGKEIDIYIKDDASDINVANNVAIEFNQEKVNLIVGPFLSSMEGVVNTGMKNFNHLYVSPSMSTSNLSGIDDNFFRVIGDNLLMARDLFQVVENSKAERILILQDVNNKAFTDVLKNELVSQLANSKSALIGIQEIEDEINSEAILEVIKIGNVDGVIILTGSIKASRILQTFYANDVKTNNFVSTWALSNALIVNAGIASEGLYGVGFYDAFSQDERIKAFREKYIERFDSPPASTSILAYDAMMLLAKAIEDADSTKVAKVKKALKEIGRFQGVTGEFEINEFGDAIRPYARLRIIEGEIRAIK